MGSLNPWSLFLVVLVFAGFPACGLGGRCDRLVTALGSPKSPLSGRFEVTISGEAENYVPGEKYRVRVQGTPIIGEVDPEHRHSFSGFMLTVDAVRDVGGGPRGMSSHWRTPAGNFSLYGDTKARFDAQCPHGVTHTSTIRKTAVEVQWTAPGPGSGCVVFRALVIESGGKWYADDGALSKELCEEVQSNNEEILPVLEECCACQEAKYEVAFEGLWSRNTHPKDFPADLWSTRFSDVIGASHDYYYKFWDYNEVASQGLRELAQEGATRTLESELKGESEHIRTIIKARGISHPNMTGRTFAVFRADRKNHLISLVSKLVPSPDWFVGVTNFELCFENCSWVEQKTLKLYPVDAGTDSGLSYEDPDIETRPQEPIRKITASFPNDEGSPFYDPEGKPIKPVALISIARHKLYEKSCKAVAGLGDGTTVTEGCELTPWSSWGPCSPSCGKYATKLRQREYVNPAQAKALGCSDQRTSRRTCGGLPPCHGPHTSKYGQDFSQFDDANCELTPWSSWSSCTECNNVKTRHRKFKNPSSAKSCPTMYKDKDLFSENDECDGKSSGSNCKPDSELSSECRLTEWTQFSPCSVTCGEGTQERTRQIEGYNYVPAGDTIQSGPCENALVRERAQCYQSSCDLDPNSVPVVCRLPADAGPCRADIQRWYFSPSHHACLHFQYGGCRGNRNNFKNHRECEQVCRPLKEQLSAARKAAQEKFALEAPGAMSHHSVKPTNLAPTQESESGWTAESLVVEESSGVRGRVIDCQLSPWSEWSPCDKTCGNGHSTRRRSILQHPYNGGSKCSKHLQERRQCRELPPCIVHDDADCQMSNWSRWSECSASCGDYSFRQRSRIILREDLPGGAPCGARTETEKCFTFPCPLRS